VVHRDFTGRGKIMLTDDGREDTGLSGSPRRLRPFWPAVAPLTAMAVEVKDIAPATEKGAIVGIVPIHCRGAVEGRERMAE